MAARPRRVQRHVIEAFLCRVRSAELSYARRDRAMPADARNRISTPHLHRATAAFCASTTTRYATRRPRRRLRRAAHGNFGINHHTDSGAVTILLQDDQPGLQVFGAVMDAGRAESRRRSWSTSAMWCRCGRTTAIRAALHRVLASSSAERYSAPYFFNPAPDCVLRAAAQRAERRRTGALPADQLGRVPRQPHRRRLRRLRRRDPDFRTIATRGELNGRTPWRTPRSRSRSNSSSSIESQGRRRDGVAALYADDILVWHNFTTRRNRRRRI